MAPLNLPMNQEQGFTGDQGAPALIGGQWFRAHNGDNIIRSGDLGEVNLKIVISQRGCGEGCSAREHMQLGSAIGKEPLAVAEQAIEDTSGSQGVCTADQVGKNFSVITEINLGGGQFVKYPAEGQLAVRAAERNKTIASGYRTFSQVAVVGEHPVIPTPLAVKRVAVLKGHDTLGGFADVGNRAMGLEIQAGDLGGQWAKSGRCLLTIDRDTIASRIEAGKTPTIDMVTCFSPTPDQAPEGEGHVSGSVGAERKQFTHQALATTQWGRQSRKASYDHGA